MIKSAIDRPSLFIGSSKEHLEIAKLFKTSIEEEGCAQVTVWSDSNVFELGETYLNTLLEKLKTYDYAAFILAGDDKINSRKEIGLTPRDNILLESGISLGILGLHNTFLIIDNDHHIKIPSDLEGLTLAEYDGQSLRKSKRKKDIIKSTCSKLFSKISENAKSYEYLLGKWYSHYSMPYKQGHANKEVVKISSFQNGISISSVKNSKDSKNDYYKSFGKVTDHKVIGEWQSIKTDNDAAGIFLLIIEPDGKFMYGYFTTSDDTNSIKISYWILVKEKEKPSKDILNQLFKRATQILKDATILPPIQNC